MAGVFIPPPPKELQKVDGNRPQEGNQPQPETQNTQIVRPMQEPLPIPQEEEKPAAQEREKKKKKEPKIGGGNTKGRVVLCVAGLIASLGIVAFIVYLLVA